MDRYHDTPVDFTAGPIVRFYSGVAPDSEGRTLQEIQGWDYDKLEQIHDYIQWLFPTTEHSQFNMDAPVLDAAQIQAFRLDERLQAQLLRSFQLMLSFYGFTADSVQQPFAVVRAPTWDARKRAWLQRGNHNFLRITRILTSLHLLGLEVQAQAFFAALSDVYHSEAGDVIGQSTYQYWQHAMTSKVPTRF